MLKITIELQPFGDEKRSKVIASGTISLQAKGATAKKGDYKYALSAQSNSGQGYLWRNWANGILEDFPRSNENCWRLLYRILKQVYGD